MHLSSSVSSSRLFSFPFFLINLPSCFLLLWKRWSRHCLCYYFSHNVLNKRYMHTLKQKMCGFADAKHNKTLYASRSWNVPLRIVRAANIPIGVLTEQERTRYRYAQDTSEPHTVSIVCLIKIMKLRFSLLASCHLHSLNFYIVQFSATNVLIWSAKQT